MDPIDEGSEPEDTGTESVQVNNPTDLVPMIVKIRDTVVKQHDSLAELREEQTRCTEDLKAKLEEQRTELTRVSTIVTEINEEHEAETREFWDGVGGGEFTNKVVAGMWGYGNYSGELGVLTRAMCAPKAEWDWRSKRFVKDGDYPMSKTAMQMNDILFLYGIHKAYKSTGVETPESYQAIVKGTQTYQLLLNEIAHSDSSFRKALSSTTAGSGDEWVPTQFSAQFIDDYRLALKVAALFQRVLMPDRSGPFTVPAQGGRLRMYLTGEATTDSATEIAAISPGTRATTFTAVKHAGLINWSDEIDEDSAVAMAPLVLAELRQAMVDGEEESIISGDLTSTHMDSDVTSGADIRKSYNGLRDHSGGSSGVAAVDTGTKALATQRNIRKAMGRFGIYPSDMAWIEGISGYVQLLSITEVETLNVYGQTATVLSGELARLDGIPVIVSEFIREDLTTAGVYDGSTTTDTIELLVNHRAFAIGDKGTPVSESGRDIKVQQNYSVASRRIDFQQTADPSATEETVGLGYGITS